MNKSDQSGRGREAEALLRRRKFIQLPLKERRDILRQQAERLWQHYEDTAEERQRLQGGGFYEYPAPDDA